VSPKPESYPLLALPTLVLALGIAAAAQDPSLQPPRLLPGSPSAEPAAGTQRSAALAAGASSTLLVYEDSRAGDSDLFGVRLDAAGAPLDVPPFAITKAAGNQTLPHVAWNGQDWLVAYSNQVDPGSGYFAYQVAAQRVSAQGQVLDAAPIAIASDDTGGNFGLASDGQNWVVLYTGYTAGNNDIRAKRIGPTGTLLDATGIVVFPGSYYVVFGLSAAHVQGEYLFTWTDNGLRGRRFTEALQPIDPSPVLLPADPGSLVSNGTEFLVAYGHQTPLFTSEILGRRLDASLAPVGAGPITISGSAPNVNHTDPRAAWDGTQWLVSWLTSGTLVAKAARVSAAGVVLDPGGATVPDANPGYFYETALGALPSGGALFAWDDIRNNSTYDVFGAVVAAQGGIGAERCFSTGSEALRSPRVTAGKGQMLISYRAETAVGSRVLVQRVDPSGAALDPEPIEVAAATHLGLYAGGAAWNGSVYLVTWSDTSQGQVFARRLLPSGAWLDAVAIPVLLGGAPDAAALDSDFLVTGLRAPTNPQYVFSYGARVRGSDGAVLDETQLLIGPSFATRARVATLGGRWLVLTESHATHDENPSSLMLNFVTSAGAVTPSVSAGSLNIQDWGSVDIAASGTSALVVGQSGSNWTNTEIYSRRVLPDGSMPAPMLKLTGADPMGQSRATAGWTGEEYVVAYQSLQNNAWFYDYEPDVYALRLTEGGTPIDVKGFALWNGEDYEVSADAGSLGGGTALFAVSRFVDSPWASFRVDLRTMDLTCQADLGYASPGGPTLSICGGDLTAAGGAAMLTLSGATPSAPVFLPVGLAASPTPFKGGTLVPVPWLAMYGLSTGVDGTVHVPITGGSGPAVTLVLQAIDASAAFRTSNAISLVLGI